MTTPNEPMDPKPVQLHLVCPKCRGSQGYYFKQVKHYQQYVDWFGRPIYADDGEYDLGKGYESKTARCIDCDYRFNRAEVTELVATDKEPK